MSSGGRAWMPDFAGAHVAAAQAELAHAGEGELAQVALLDARLVTRGMGMSRWMR